MLSGTKETLWDIPNSKNISIRDKLLEFHSKWYSSHLMYLTVLGKGIYRHVFIVKHYFQLIVMIKCIEDLNTLEELVVSLFGNIEKKNIDMPIWTEPIYKEEQLATKTIVVPVKDIRILSVNFPIPDQSKYYESMVNNYLSNDKY